MSNLARDFADMRDDASIRSAIGGAQPTVMWGDPKPIGTGLPAVAPFDLALLPAVLQDFAGDISERMQTPPDFVAVASMVSAGAVIGCKLGVRPQSHTDWHEVPNLWGCIVGRPGVMKSPSLKAALRPLSAIEADARRAFESEQLHWEAGEIERDVRAQAQKAAMKDRLKDDPQADVSDLKVPPPVEPLCKRYVVNDSSYQSLGMLLVQNPNGLLVHRDEMVSLLKSLDGEQAAEARGFYLQAWNGGDSYTFDRVGRGLNQHIPSVTLSLLGSTQPGKIREYVSEAVRGGSGDDGLIQRFGMLVWPDMPNGWTEHDRIPNAAAMAAATRMYAGLSSLSHDAIGANVDEGDEKRPYLRFDPDARHQFREWHEALERRLRSGDLHPAVESHLAKYRKLVPSLALIHHLASGNVGSVCELSLLAALGWADYLETHAMRVYAAATDGALEGARTIVKRIKKGDLETVFSPRIVQRKGWSGLTDLRAVNDAIDVLEEHGWVAVREEPAGPRGGRPKTLCTINPRALR